MRRFSGKTPASLYLSLGILAACQAAPVQPATARIDPQVAAAAQALAHGLPTDARTDSQGRLLVYVYVTDTRTDTLERLVRAGLADARPSSEVSVVQGWIAPQDLDTLAGLSCVKNIALPRYSSPR